MENNDVGISGLIKRIQQDGIDSAEKIKSDIVAAAKLDAAKIVEEAKLRSNKILLEANSESAKIKEQLDLELRISVRDFILTFSDHFKGDIVLPIVNKSVSDCFSDSEFVKKCLFHLIKKNKTDDIGSGFLSVVSEEMVKKINDYFSSSIVKNAIKQDVCINSSKSMKGFSLRKNGANYFWDFTVDTITDEIAGLVEPGLRKYFVPKITK
jgi:vacuolar-type H+-ATPase subunit E/Vma4